jgi:pimeloyl-ACP methyl ester carboxylesterase
MARTEASVTTTISRDGTPIGCWRSGEGPPLVLVHAATVDHSSWDPLLSALTPHFTVYAMDRRGRGSSGDGPTYAGQREFEDIAAVVDSIGGPVSLVGHSYGALCSLEAARLTQTIGKLLLYEPPVVPESTRFPIGFIAELEGLIAQGRRDETVIRFMQVVLERSQQDIERSRGEPTWAIRVATAHVLVRETAFVEGYRFEPGRFTDIKTPTLLLEGEATQPFNKVSTQAVHAALPNSRVAVMAGQGHFAQRTAPDLLATEVLSFLL